MEELKTQTDSLTGNPDKLNEDVLLLKRVLPRGFRNKIKNASVNYTIIRSNVKNLEECSHWINEYSRRSNSKWITRTTKPRPTRFLCRKVYVCHHSRYRKRDAKNGKKTKNLDCKATIDILVKISTRHTKKKDPYIQKGMAAVIKIKNGHNHSLDAIEVLSALPATVETKNCFKCYFNNGLGVAEALHYHSSQLALIKKEDMLENTTVNPKYRTVQYWYDQWRKQAASNGDVVVNPARPRAPKTKNNMDKDKSSSNKKVSVKKESQLTKSEATSKLVSQPRTNQVLCEEKGIMKEVPIDDDENLVNEHEEKNNSNTQPTQHAVQVTQNQVHVTQNIVQVTQVTQRVQVQNGLQITHNQPQIVHSGPQIAHIGSQIPHNGVQIVHTAPQIVQNGSHLVHNVAQVMHNGSQIAHNGAHITQNLVQVAHNEVPAGQNVAPIWPPPPQNSSDGFDQLGLYLADCLRKIKDPSKRRQYEHKLLQAMVGMDGEDP